jgi:hypothetical protein
LGVSWFANSSTEIAVSSNAQSNERELGFERPVELVGELWFGWVDEISERGSGILGITAQRSSRALIKNDQVWNFVKNAIGGVRGSRWG